MSDDVAAGDGAFNTPPLVESADTGPFFHNNSINTIEGAVAFYNSDEFNNLPSVVAIGGIDLGPTQVEAVAAFLRVINALENIRVCIELLDDKKGKGDKKRTKALLKRAASDAADSVAVLEGGGLHPEGVAHLKKAQQHIEKAKKPGDKNAKRAIGELKKAKALLTE